MKKSKRLRDFQQNKHPIFELSRPLNLKMGFSNKSRFLIAILSALVLSIVLLVHGDRFHSAIAQTAESTLPPICIAHNSLSQTNLPTIIGRKPNSSYIVAIPDRRHIQLDRVRQCVPDAFYTRSRLGQYVHAGSFPRRSLATKLVHELRSRQIDARIIYSNP